MTLSVADLARARETTAGLLDELGLEAYFFDVEPHEGQWELKVDCAMEPEGVWGSVTLWAPKEMLLTSQDDASLRQRILAEWRAHLIACKRRAR